MSCISSEEDTECVRPNKRQGWLTAVLQTDYRAHGCTCFCRNLALPYSALNYYHHYCLMDNLQHVLKTLKNWMPHKFLLLNSDKTAPHVLSMFASAGFVSACHSFGELDLRYMCIAQYEPFALTL